VGDIVRFIGTDKHLTVKQCRTELRLYQTLSITERFFGFGLAPKCFRSRLRRLMMAPGSGSLSSMLNAKELEISQSHLDKLAEEVRRNPQ
jgi:hypothetical protein